MAYLTPALLEECRALRRQHFGWHVISQRLGVSAYVLRCAVEVGYREYKNGLGVRPRNIRPRAPSENKSSPRREISERRPRRASAEHAVTAFDRVPPDVLRDRDARHAASLEPRTLTETFFGDPLPGYSALDQRAKR